MATSHVISGLIAKRAKVAGQIALLEAEAARLRTALTHLDGTLAFLDPAIKPAGMPRRLPRRPPVVPHLARRALDVLRTSGQPMTAREMAAQLLDQDGADADLPRLAEAIGKCMNRADGRLVEPASRRKRPARWRLITE